MTDLDIEIPKLRIIIINALLVQKILFDSNFQGPQSIVSNNMMMNPSIPMSLGGTNKGDST